MNITATLKTIPLYLDKLDAAFNLGHALAVRKADNDVSFFQKLAKNKTLLVALETISFLGNSIFLGVKIEQNWKLFSKLAPFPEIIALTGLGAGACLTLGSLGIVALVNKIALGTFTFNENDNRDDLRLTKTTHELFSNFRYATRIVVQLATLYFAPTNPFFLFSAACEVYGLLKMTKRKWVTFDGPGQAAFISVPATLGISVKALVDALRSKFITHHLNAKEAFTVDISPLQTRFISFEKTFWKTLKHKKFWKIVALTTLCCTLSIFARLVGIARIKESVNMIGKYVNVYINGSFNHRRIYTETDHTVEVFTWSITSLVLALLSCLGFAEIIGSLKPSKGLVREQEFYSSFLSHPLLLNAGDISQLRNETIGDNGWQDPITFEVMRKDQILSPATLIIDKMAFSMESTLLQLFSHHEDQKVFRESLSFTEPTLQHPIYRNLLSIAEQDRVIDQICRTFMISRSQFINCWNLSRDRVPLLPFEDVRIWYQSAAKLSDHEMASLPSNPDTFIRFLEGSFTYEFHTFLNSERATYFQLMRLNNFSKLLPKNIRERLEKNLPPETIEKLRRVKNLA